MSLTLRQVRYFVATAEIGQISQAAIHLNISQSAVTTAIKELEALLGVQLFVRSSQGMNLTDAGRHFLNRAYVIVRSVDDALNSPLPDYRASGVLRLAASYTVLGYFLPHHLQRMSIGTRTSPSRCSNRSARPSNRACSTASSIWRWC